MSDNYRPAVGDKVILLKGGSIDTYCEPPLKDGEIYTIEEDIEGVMHYRLNGAGSRVLYDEVKLVEKAASD